MRIILVSFCGEAILASILVFGLYCGEIAGHFTIPENAVCGFIHIFGAGKRLCPGNTEEIEFIFYFIFIAE